MKKLINVYDLTALKNLSREDVFFLIAALKIHPAFKTLKMWSNTFFFLLFLYLILKGLKLKISISRV